MASTIRLTLANRPKGVARQSVDPRYRHDVAGGPTRRTVRLRSEKGYFERLRHFRDGFCEIDERLKDRLTGWQNLRFVENYIHGQFSIVVKLADPGDRDPDIRRQAVSGSPRAGIYLNRESC